jgi:pimeloyl-ACP methyl ester carboxylesterase
MEDGLMYGSIQSNGMRLQYYRTGGEKPPIVLLHGFTDNGLSWTRFPLVLKTSFDVIIMDARAHGISGVPQDGSGYSPMEQAEDVAALIQHLDLEKAIILGHSMGAATAISVAVKYPEVVDSLVLIDPPLSETVLYDTQEAIDQAKEELKERISAWREMSFDEIEAIAKKKHPEWPDVEYFQWAKAKQQLRVEAANAVADFQMDWQRIVKPLDCPVLLVTADVTKGGLVTPEIAEKVKTIWSNCEVLHIKDAGHSPHRDQYKEFSKGVMRFLDHQLDRRLAEPIKNKKGFKLFKKNK